MTLAFSTPHRQGHRDETCRAIALKAAAKTGSDTFRIGLWVIGQDFRKVNILHLLILELSGYVSEL